MVEMPKKSLYWKDPDRYRKAAREYGTANTDRKNRWGAAWLLNNPRRYLYIKAKTRAKAAGILFGITVDDIVIPDLCPVLGIRLEGGLGKGVPASPASPSVDRIIPELGYVPGNVRVISMRANVLKRDATAAELEAIAAYIRRETAPVPPHFGLLSLVA
jgi:hypothetical protein